MSDSPHDSAAAPAPVDAPPQPRYCAHHERTLAPWQCGTCDASFCDDCVRIYNSRDGKVASCRQCGDLCVDPHHPPMRREFRAGGVEDERDRRARYLRDLGYPVGTIAIAVPFIFAVGFMGGGVFSGLFHAVVLLAFSSTLLLSAIVLLGNGGWADFGEGRYTLLKAVAIAAAMHGTRAAAALFTGVSGVKGEVGFVADTFAAVFTSLFLAMITFLAVPLFALAIAVSLFYEMVPSEKTAAITALMFVETASLVLLLMVA